MPNVDVDCISNPMAAHYYFAYNLLIWACGRIALLGHSQLLPCSVIFFIFYFEISALFFEKEKPFYLSYRSFLFQREKKIVIQSINSYRVNSTFKFNVCSFLADQFELLLLVTWRSLDSIALESGTNLKSVTADEADSPSTNIRVRRLFPEVWLFNSTTAGLVFALTLSLSFSYFQCLYKSFFFQNLFSTSHPSNTMTVKQYNNFGKTFETLNQPRRHGWTL